MVTPFWDHKQEAVDAKHISRTERNIVKIVKSLLKKLLKISLISIFDHCWGSKYYENRRSDKCFKTFFIKKIFKNNSHGIFKVQSIKAKF